MLESSPNSAPQLPNPPPSPTCIESPSTAASSLPNNSFNDVMGQLMNQLGHEVDTMKFQQITSNLLWKSTVLLSKKKNIKNIPHSPRFIKTLSEHLPLGSFSIEELLA